MKIFLDTANVEEIRQGIEWGLVDGVTTNPSLMEKEKVNNFPAVVKSILAVTKGEHNMAWLWHREHTL